MIGADHGNRTRRPGVVRDLGRLGQAGQHVELDEVQLVQGFAQILDPVLRRGHEHQQSEVATQPLDAARLDIAVVANDEPGDLLEHSRVVPSQCGEHELLAHLLSELP